MHPYRNVALVPVPAEPPVRRPRGAGWIAGVTAAIAAVCLAAGAPVLPAFVAATVAFAAQQVVEDRRRRRALAIIAGLPFPVRHDSEAAVDLAMSARAVRSLRFELKDGEDVVFGDWIWGRHDVVRLAHLLSTVGTELHTTRGVVAAEVWWGTGGPVGSI